MGVGIDVPRHYDLTCHIDNVVSQFGSDVLGDSRHFAVSGPQVEPAVNVVCGIDHAAILQNKVELLWSCQWPINLCWEGSDRCPEMRGAILQSRNSRVTANYGRYT